MFAIFCFLLVGMLVITFSIDYSIFCRDIDRIMPTPQAIILLGLISMLSLTRLPICWFQHGLRRKIRRNYLSAINAFLEPDKH